MQNSGLRLSDTVCTAPLGPILTMWTGNRKTNKNRKSQAGNGTIKRHWLGRRGKEDTGFGRKNKRHCGDRKAVRHMVRTEKFNNTRFGQQKH